MPYTARELITKAYYKSGIVSRTFQSIGKSEITDGLTFLNDILAVEGSTGILIPYFKEYSLNAVAGQEKYFIPNLITLETFTFNIGVVRYSMRTTARNKYFGSSRADNITSLPYEWHFERSLNGADLYIHFLPDQNYPMKIWGKFGLDEITDLCDDLLLAYDRFYIEYLCYALAQDICIENQEMTPLALQKGLRRLEGKMRSITSLDYSTKKISSFQRGVVFNYAQANLGNGWCP